MTYLDYAVRFALACAIVALVAGCGESTSTARPTAPATEGPAATAPMEMPVAALSASEAGEHATPTPRAAEPAAPAALSNVQRPAPVESVANAAASPSSAATNSGEAREINGLLVQRLVVAHDVQNREPVGEEQPFMVDGEPVFAFVHLVNSSNADQRIMVSFQREDGREVGPVSLEVPANSRRWRTWARSSWLRAPGQWTVVVRTESGEILDSAQFEIES